MNLKNIKSVLIHLVSSLVITACGNSTSINSQEVDLPLDKKVQQNSNWNNSVLPTTNNHSAISFEATPSSENIDGVIGLSNGKANKYSDLALIVRFAPNGYIDARDGKKYNRIDNIKYYPNKSYSFRLDINFDNHTYDIYVTPKGGTEIKIGNNFAFRSEQKNLNSLNNIAHFTANNKNLSLNLLSSNNIAWNNHSINTQNSNTTATFVATPSAENIDGVIGFSNGEANAYSDLALIVRFAPSGYIDARDGGKYRKENNIKYNASINYRFVLDINFENHTYDIYVSIDDSSKIIQIGDNFKFRSEQSNLNSINNIAYYLQKGTNNIILHDNDYNPIVFSNMLKKIPKSNIGYIELGNIQREEKQVILIKDISNPNNLSILHMFSFFHPLGSNIYLSGISEDNKKLYFSKYSNEEDLKIFILNINDKDNIISSSISFTDYPYINSNPEFTIDSSKLILSIDHNFYPHASITLHNLTGHGIDLGKKFIESSSISQDYSQDQTRLFQSEVNKQGQIVIKVIDVKDKNNQQLLGRVILEEARKDYRIENLAYNKKKDELFIKLIDDITEKKIYKIYNISNINTPTLIDSNTLKTRVLDLSKISSQIIIDQSSS